MSLVQSLGKNEMSVPWRANWSRVQGPSSENRGVSWAISWFFMEIGLRPRWSSTGKAHRVKKKTSSHWHRNRCSRKKSEIVFVYKHFKRNFLDLWPPFNFVQIRHWRTNLLKWWRSTCCAYASDIIWSFGLWIINVASKMSSVLITAYTQTCVTTLLPVTAHHTQRYTWIVSQQLHSSETRKRNKKQPICKKQKQAGHIFIDTQEMTSQSTGNGRL